MQGSLTNLLLLISLAVAPVFGNPGVGSEPSRTAKPRREKQRCALCQMEPNRDLGAESPSVTGLVLFSQTFPFSKLNASFNLQGFAQSDLKSQRAIHVHQYGVVNGDCYTTGPHYNPRNVNHPQHPGDFHNFQVKDGRIVKTLRNLRAKLFGLESILGRGLVLHEGKDDLGRGDNPESLKTGNSGGRLACCTITLINCDLWSQMVNTA